MWGCAHTSVYQGGSIIHFNQPATNTPFSFCLLLLQWLWRRVPGLQIGEYLFLSCGGGQPTGETHGPCQTQARISEPVCISPREATGRTDVQSKQQFLVLNKRWNKMHFTAAPMLSCTHHPLRYLVLLNCPGGFSILTLAFLVINQRRGWECSGQLWC